MHREKRRFVLAVASACFLVLGVASASSEIRDELIGTWDYESLTAVRNGERDGTVHFRPGQWTVRFDTDATWVMKGPPPSGGLSGAYEVHGHDLTMKANGRQDMEYRFAVKKNGRVLMLKDKGVIIIANRE